MLRDGPGRRTRGEHASRRHNATEYSAHGCGLSHLSLAPWLGGQRACLPCVRRRRRDLNPWLGKISCRRAWQPTPVFLPGESHAQRSLTRVHRFTESDTTQHMWIRSVQPLSCVRLFVTSWTAARQASLPITNSRSSLKLMSTESVMPSSHLILSSPSPPAPNLSQHQGLFK